MDGPTEGARDLVLAIFRLAVADYLGLAYGHQEVGRARRVELRFSCDAEAFLRSPWADCLADWINLTPRRVWHEARAIALKTRDVPVQAQLTRPALAKSGTAFRVAA